MQVGAQASSAIDGTSAETEPSSPPARAALGALIENLRTGKKLVALTGSASAAVAASCRKQLARDGQTPIALAGGALSPGDLLRTMRLCLGGEEEDKARETDVKAVFEEIGARLRALAAEGHGAVVIVEDADALPVATLESLRLLSDLDAGATPSLRTVLVGGSGLERALDSEALRSRVAAHLRIDAAPAAPRPRADDPARVDTARGGKAAAVGPRYRVAIAACCVAAALLGGTAAWLWSDMSLQAPSEPVAAAEPPVSPPLATPSLAAAPPEPQADNPDAGSLREDEDLAKHAAAPPEPTAAEGSISLGREKDSLPK